MIVEMQRRVCGPQPWIATAPVGANKEQAEGDTGRLQAGKTYDLPQEVAEMLLTAPVDENGREIHPPAAKRPDGKTKATKRAALK